MGLDKHRNISKKDKEIVLNSIKIVKVWVETQLEVINEKIKELEEDVKK